MTTSLDVRSTEFLPNTPADCSDEGCTLKHTAKYGKIVGLPKISVCAKS
jgi:hypothetical protein